MIDQRCGTANPVTGVLLTDNEATITNSHSHSRCRWKICLHKGQKVNITLLDFGVLQHLEGNEQRPVVCKKYAVIKEVATGKETIVCSGTARMRNVFLSEGHEIEVQTLGGQTEEDGGPRYALHYTGMITWENMQMTSRDS